MHTQDIVRELLNQDEGRWRTANKNGHEIDEYYLREKLKKLLPSKSYLAQTKSRRWRSTRDPKGNPLYGYQELHFENAFSRYLGKELPSKSPQKSEPADDDPQPDPRPDPDIKEPMSVYPSSTGGTYPEFIRHSDTGG
jgi:hypothetical protein